jgi:hypothetical protein
VALLAVDALDLETVREMAERGELPAIARMLREGALAPVAVERPAEPGVVWTTLATGLRWKRHGVWDVPLPGVEGGIVPSGAALRAPSVWEIAAREGRSALEAGWSAPVPVPQAERDSLTEASPPWDRPFVDPRASDRAALERAVAEPVDLLVLRLREPGVVALLGWGRHRRGVEGYTPPRDAVEKGDPVPAAYRRIDEAVAELRRTVGPGGHLLLVSSSSVEPLVPPRSFVLDLDLLLERLGYLRFEPAGAGTSRAERRIDLEETRVWSHAPPTAWPSLGNRVRFLFVNRSRISEGDLPRFRRGFAWVLRQVRTEGRTPLFREVGVYHGPALPGVRIPDLYAIPNPEALEEEAVVRGEMRVQVLEELVYRYDLPTGGPAPPGWLLLAGPGVPRGEAPPLDMQDVSVLLLLLQGVAPPPGLDGHVPARLVPGPADSGETG